MKPHVRVVAAVVCQGGKVHIQQRAAGGKRGGLWEFAGGKVEHGETDEDALARELREELNIIALVRSYAKLAEVFYEYPDATCNVALYRVLYWHGTLQTRVAQAEKWVDRAGFELWLPEMVPSMALLYRQNPNLW